MIPGPDTPLTRMQEIVSGEQAGDIGIWGKIERVAGSETDVYDLWIAVADFSVEPPRMIYQKKARTRTVERDPAHLCQGGPRRPLRPTRRRSPRFPIPRCSNVGNKAANLVQGDFERGGAAPLGGGPLPHDVTWGQQRITRRRNRKITSFASPRTRM